jgi:hypothetical protein
VELHNRKRSETAHQARAAQLAEQGVPLLRGALERSRRFRRLDAWEQHLEVRRAGEALAARLAMLPPAELEGMTGEGRLRGLVERLSSERPAGSG